MRLWFSDTDDVLKFIFLTTLFALEKGWGVPCLSYLLNNGDKVLVLGVVGGARLGQINQGPYPGWSRLGRSQPGFTAKIVLWSQL